MTTALHIHTQSGYYLGQVKGYGCRTWRTVVKTRNSAKHALAGAVRKMASTDKRARAIFCTDDGWYEPDVVMEASKK